MDELHVLLDTNVVWTESPVDLVNRRVKDEIQRVPTDISVRWYLPDIVRLERQVQMEKQARNALPKAIQICRLVDGIRIDLSEELLSERVGQRITRELTELGIEVVTLDYSSIDWAKLVMRSAYRFAPFESDPKCEKGFKDALVLEAYKQLCQSKNLSRSLRCAIVTDDVRLLEAVNSDLEAIKYSHALSNLEELRNIVGVMSSEISDDLAKLYQDKSQVLFGKRFSVFREMIEERYSDKLQERPDNASYTKRLQWFYSLPSLVSKNGSTLTWNTFTYLEVDAFRMSQVDAYVPNSNTLVTSYLQSKSPTLFGTSPMASAFNTPVTIRSPEDMWSGVNIIPGSLSNRLIISHDSPKNESILVAHGKVSFDVQWTTVISQAGNLIRARPVSAEYVDTQWSEP